MTSIRLAANAVMASPLRRDDTNTLQRGMRQGIQAAGLGRPAAI